MNDFDPSATVVCLADVAPERISWLWVCYLPLGKLVVWDGDPGDGKSTAATDLMARVTTGSPWPDGALGGAPADVVLMSAEDGLADTISPRLHAAGALFPLLRMRPPWSGAQRGWLVRRDRVNDLLALAEVNGWLVRLHGHPRSVALEGDGEDEPGHDEYDPHGSLRGVRRFSSGTGSEDRVPLQHANADHADDAHDEEQRLSHGPQHRVGEAGAHHEGVLW